LHLLDNHLAIVYEGNAFRHDTSLLSKSFRQLLFCRKHLIRDRSVRAEWYLVYPSVHQGHQRSYGWRHYR
jgi:hypothetical protein